MSGAAKLEVDIASIIDRSLSPYQLFVFALCAMVVFLDGINVQIIGIAAPLISKEFHTAHSLVGWAIAAGMLGAMLGSPLCGLLADMFGRKPILICATVFFGVCTVATATVHDYAALLWLRLLTGIGLGGAVPCFISLTSEYSPQRYRASIVSLLWAAFPLGAALGALINSYMIGFFSWRSLFLLWGAASLFVAAIHLFALPEFVRFLLLKKNRDAKILVILNRIRPGSTPPGTKFVMPETTAPRISPGELFGPALRTATWSLAVLSFVVLSLLTVGAAWTPTLLTPFGFSASAAAIIVAFNGFGSFIGTTGAGFLLGRVGIVRSIVPALLGTALSFMALGFATFSFNLVGLASFLAGFSLGLASSSMLALASLTYPTAIRSTGIGFAMGAGRFGAFIVPALVGLLVQARWDIVGVMLALAALAVLPIPCVLLLARRRSSPLAPAIPDQP